MCWRLARQLAAEPGRAIRLWVDDLASFRRICPQVNPARKTQRIANVDIAAWLSGFGNADPAEVVIEAFGVHLPEDYLQAMAVRRPPPVWINLEYLSAEPWVEECHGMPSPHPRLPLTKYFFFPGFTPATGGLLMEKDYAVRRDAFQADRDAMAAFWRALAVPVNAGELRVSLFCYENDALPELARTWAGADRAVACIVPEGPALRQLSHIAGMELVPGTRCEIGRLAIHPIAFLNVDDYDKLLWAADINFVRGEDSFVRAQLAARPLIWQAYPQEDQAQRKKVAAFTNLYARSLSPPQRLTVERLFEAWNDESADIVARWQAWSETYPALALHARRWADELAGGNSLAAKLAEFCENRLK